MTTPLLLPATAADDRGTLFTIFAAAEHPRSSIRQFRTSAIRQSVRPTTITLQITDYEIANFLRPSKRKGEFIEAVFLAKCIALGFNVCKPWGDSARFDFMLEREGHRPLRIQLKSSWVLPKGRRQYRVLTTANGRRYLRSNVDFVVAYLVAEDAWYIVPITAVHACNIAFSPASRFRPGARRYPKTERFRDRWNLLDN